MAIRYTEEEKQSALKRMGEIGVRKTSEELHISIQTLYKWKNTKSEETTKQPTTAPSGRKAKEPNIATSEIRQLIIEPVNNDKAVIKALKEENEKLVDMNIRLRKVLSTFID